MIEKINDHAFKLGEKLFKPLMIGAMGVDISTSALALEAARLGGIGHISDAMVPFVSDKRFGTRFQHNKFEQFREHIKSQDKSLVKWAQDVVYEASKRHSRSTMEAKQGVGGIFVNIMEKLTMGAPRDTLCGRLRGALDGGIDGITLSAGLHCGTLRLIEDHPRFREAFIGIIVSSVRALKVFLRSAGRLRRLPDYIVVEGPLAGGHLGFGMDWKKYDLKTIVKEVLAFLKKEGLDIPVVPAGGIFSGRDGVEYLGLGAKALQVATRFVISKESGFPDTTKQKYLQANEDDIVVNMTSPAGYPMRMLKSSPSLNSSVKPSCEALGYLLDGEGHCAYKDLYQTAPTDENGKKLPIKEKMCICSHFMKYTCYTCGHNTYRLKNITHRYDNGEYYLPTVEQIMNDYLYHEDVEVARPPVGKKTIMSVEHLSEQPCPA